METALETGCNDIWSRDNDDDDAPTWQTVAGSIIATPITQLILIMAS